MPNIDPPLGRYSGKLDDKGRLKLPVRMQEYIEALPDRRRLFVTSLNRRTAVIYPIGLWRENLKFFETFKKDPKASKVVWFTANDLGTEETMDGQGRVLLNSDLRTALKLEDKAQLHMYTDNGHIELITDSIYQEMRLQSEQEAPDAVEKLLSEGMR